MAEKTRLPKLSVAILLFSISSISFAFLTFEITLTRIFSVTYSHHYTFLAVSLAMLGLGLGGFFSQVILSRRRISSSQRVEDIFLGLASISLLFSLFVFFSIIITVTSPQNIFSDSFLLFFPFFVAGIFLAEIYKNFARLSNIIYFADLVGAALGCLSIVVFIGNFGAIKTVFIMSIVSSISSILLAFISGKRKIVFLTIGCFLLLCFCTQYLTNYNLLNVPIGSEPVKVLHGFLSDVSLGAKIIDSRWSSFGRTDLVEFEDYPGYKVIFLDGSAGSAMVQFDGSFDKGSEAYEMRSSTAYYPFHFVNKDSALIIGPGGGVDIIMALMAGVKNIVAVEVNPDIVDIVTDYSDFNGGIYTKYDNVDVLLDEGRSFLRRSTMKYDVIMLNLPVTRTAQGVSGYSLSENYLFTIGSFRDYLNHLEDDGHLVVVAHSDLEINKLVAITIEVLQEEENIQDVLAHIVITVNDDESPLPVFILKKSAFTEDEIREMYRKSAELNFVPYYFPYTNPEELSPFMASLATGAFSLSELTSLLSYDIRPPTDDRPFFYKFKKGIPSTFLQPLIGAFILSTFILISYIIARKRDIRSSLARKSRKRAVRSSLTGKSKISLFTPYYFSSLGLGFMLIEISLLQKFMLFGGHPTYTISMILFSLLLSSGIGGLCSKKLQEKSLFSEYRPSLIIGSIVILYIFVLTPIFKAFLIYSSIIRFFISFMLLFPLGFFMGTLFPFGIKILEIKSKGDIAWMWCLNSTFSLLGSILAVVLGMSLGFNFAFLFGGCVYLIIFVVGRVKFKHTR